MANLVDSSLYDYETPNLSSKRYKKSFSMNYMQVKIDSNNVNL